MRELATFAERSGANQLADVLEANEIETHLDEGKDSTWRVWVIDDADLTAALGISDDLAADPSSDRWTEVAKKGNASRSVRARESAVSATQTEEAQREVTGALDSMLPSWLQGIGKVTLGLMVVSIGFALISSLGDNMGVTTRLTIASFKTSGEMIFWNGLGDIENGQLWRLFTPMLIHFTPLHLVFNMMWLKDLGSMVEREHKPWFLPLMVLVISGISNVGQYYWPPMSPTFGGMSGVVYGLLGYLFVRGRLNPKARFAISQTIMIFMMVWLVICFTGIVGPVANGAHVVGLLVGAIWGYIGSGHLKRLIRG